MANAKLKRIYTLIFLCSICQISIAQSEVEPYQIIKIGGLRYSSVTNLGISYEFNKPLLNHLTLESWASFIETNDNGVNGIGSYFGVQVNWHPLFSKLGYNVFHISTGLAYYNGQKNSELIHEGIGLTVGLGLHYLIKRKVLIYTDAKILYFYDWIDTEYVNPQMYFDTTPILIGLGYRF